MIESLAELLLIGQSYFWTGFFVFLRVGGMMAMLPVFGERSIPVRIKLGLTVVFTLVIAPAVPISVDPVPGQLLSNIGLMAIEMGIGLTFGIFLRLFVLALQIAGSIAAQSTSLSQIFGGSAGADPAPAIGHLLVVAGLALATILGLHVRIVEMMIYSYNLLPFGVVPNAEILSEIALQEVAYSFALGFALAAPFVIASLLYNVTLGVINKAMPQLMVSFVGAPAITAGGLFLLLVSAPILLSVWVEALNSFLANPMEARP